jgi:hypothetical protein
MRDTAAPRIDPSCREQPQDTQMAFTSTIFVNVSPAASKQADGGDHRHAVTSGPSADLSISMDATKITTQSVLSTAIAMAHKLLAGQLPP